MLFVSVNATSVCRHKGTECESVSGWLCFIFESHHGCHMHGRSRLVCVWVHSIVCVLLVNSALAARDFRLGQL